MLSEGILLKAITLFDQGLYSKVQIESLSTFNNKNNIGKQRTNLGDSNFQMSNLITKVVWTVCTGIKTDA